MQYITNLLFWITSGLMIPVIIGLIFFFIRSLLMLGGFVSVYLERRRYSDELDETVKKIKTNDFAELQKVCADNNHIIHKTLLEMIENNQNEAVMEKIVTDFELEKERVNARAVRLIKFGPILGLMGTLIPMGPALAGLATGDISSMAYNMQMAFATTVVGLLTGAIGFVIQQNQSRWMRKDLAILDFIINISKQ